jgi:hypothetical protein
MITLNRKDKDGEEYECAVNPAFITSACYIADSGLTALNMDGQQTIWVTDSPRIVAIRIEEYNHG